MIELKGKYNNAKVFTDNIEQQAISQIIELCSQEFSKDSQIRIMTDCHAGAGCTIGTTMTIKDKIVPNLVGVDIGCGMYVVKLKDKEIDFQKLDKIIRNYIPSGHDINDYQANDNKTKIKDLKCFNYINYDRALRSIGTLGGGNHFIEVDKDENDDLYLVIHSGSRYLGKQVAEYYQEQGYKKLCDQHELKEQIIKELKLQHREKDIQKELSKIPKYNGNKSLAYVKGELFNNYLHDMKITQRYAFLNRDKMASVILKHMNLTPDYSFQTIHNYIDLDNMILRKGSISAQKGEQVIIPMNMRDGSLICTGKGNKDWNYSAPHGAGRILSRSQANKYVSLEEFKESMKEVWTTSVNNSTIDESPMVYKPMQEIIDNIGDTVDIVNIIKPVYNFKAN